MKKNKVSKVEVCEPSSAEISVSLFAGYENSKPIGTVSLSDFLLLPTYKEEVEKVRACTDEAQRRKLKSKLPAITPSGIFAHRCNKGLIWYSGIICIDIDGKDNPSITDWEAVKASVSDIPGLYYAGLSVGGNGLFMLFKVEKLGKHREHLAALMQDLQGRGLVPDVNCTDVSRLRGASYDPNPVFRWDTLPYSKLLPIMPTPAPHFQSVEINGDFTAFRVRRLIEIIEHTGANIADHYRDWYAVGRSLASEFGESGRAWYHIVSSKSAKYKPKECDKQYSRCLRTCSQTSIKTFFYICMCNGILAN